MHVDGSPGMMRAIPNPQSRILGNLDSRSTSALSGTCSRSNRAAPPFMCAETYIASARGTYSAHGPYSPRLSTRNTSLLEHVV